MGDVSLGYGYSWMGFDDFGPFDDDLDYPAIFGQGRVNLPYSDTVNVQLDVLGRASMDDSIFSGKSATADFSHVVLGGHINYRDDQGMLGVFAGAGRVYEFLGAPVFMAGIEGQYFCNQWTLSAQVGYLDSQESFLLSNAGFIQGGAAYYASKKLKLTGSLAYIDGEFNFYTDSDVQEWAWTLGAHYWFGGSVPVSGFIEYRGRSVDIESFNMDENTVNAGLTFHFGGDGFQDADRNGASADLPDPNWYRLIGSPVS
jgi:hypothetical protein